MPVGGHTVSVHVRDLKGDGRAWIVVYRGDKRTQQCIGDWDEAAAHEGRPFSEAEVWNVLKDFVAECEAEHQRYLEIIKNPGELFRE